VTLDDVDSPALVVRRQQHFDLRCRTSLDFSPSRTHEEAGLTVRANESFHYDLAIQLGESGREAVLRSRVRGVSRILARHPLGEGPIEIELSATAERYTFRAGPTDALGTLGSLPTRNLCTERIQASGQNHFTGTCIGLYATGNGRPSASPADFDWFDYRPL